MLICGSGLYNDDAEEESEDGGSERDEGGEWMVEYYTIIHLHLLLLGLVFLDTSGLVGRERRTESRSFGVPVPILPYSQFQLVNLLRS